MESLVFTPKNAVFKITKVCYKLGVVPYYWNSKYNQFEVTSSKLKICHWVFNVFLYNCYVTFLVARFIQLKASPNGGAGLADIQSVITASLITFSIFEEFLKTWGVFQNTTNQILQLSADLEKSTLPALGSLAEKEAMRMVGKKTKRAIRICGTITRILIVMYTARALRAPDKANHFTSWIFASPKTMKKGKVVPFVLLHSYIWCIQYFGLLYYATIHLYLTKTMREYLCLMSRGADQRGNYQRLHIFPTYYIKLGVMQKRWDYTWGKFHSYFVVTFVTAITLGIYQAVVMRTAKHIVVTGAATYCLALFVSAISAPYTSSLEVIHSWRLQAGAPLWFCKYLRSCQPLHTQNGNFGFIDKRMTLTLLAIIISNAVTLIVGHDHSQQHERDEL